MKSKTVLKQYSKPQEVLADIDSIDLAFRKQFKRAPETEFFFSQSGDIKKPQFELVAYYVPEELPFIQSFFSK